MSMFPRCLCVAAVWSAFLLANPLAAQPRKAKPFTVSGTVVDTRGKPLEGVTVWLNADFVYGRASTTTGADGRYAMGALIKATYRAKAWITAKYAGGTVCQRLAMPTPTDYNSFTVSSGAVRNFRWQLTGKIGFTDSYFGASISIWGFNGELRDAARAVEFTLTPTGPLLDGSLGAVIVKEAALDYPSSDDGLYDLPLGTYKLKAILIGRDGSRTRLNLKALGPAPYQSEIDLVWRTESRCGFGFDSGVQPFAVQLARAR